MPGVFSHGLGAGAEERALAAPAAAAIEAKDGRFRYPGAAMRDQELGTKMTGSTDTGFFTARSLVTAATCAAAALALAGCGGGKKQTGAVMAPSQVTTIGVNSYLWRASLDSLSFMPLLQSDSAGGVIITDWYINPKDPSERVKVSVMILDKDLRADALKVTAVREVAQNGGWVPAPVQAATVQKLEDIILTRARDLRRNSMGG